MVARKGIETEEGHEMANKKFQIDEDKADLDNDGELDVMVVDMTAEDNFRLKSNMSGMNPSAFWKVVKNGGYFQYMFNTLQINNGDKTFRPSLSKSAIKLAQLQSVDEVLVYWATSLKVLSPLLI